MFRCLLPPTPTFSDRLIYFGGYGCKTMGEMQNTPATNFIMEELSWVSRITLEDPPSLGHGSGSARLSGRDREHAVQVLGLEQRGQRL